MKHFKLMKGMFACLLTLALVVACFGLTFASADDEPETTGIVKFKVVVEGGGEGVAGDYTFDSELSKKGDSATLADILESAEKSGTKLEDASAWILNTKDLLKDDEVVSFSSGTFKVKSDLKADKEVEFNVAPAKLNISFKVTVDTKEYTSTFSVDNGAKTKISYSDIAAGLKRTEDEEEIALEGKVVTKIGTAKTGKYNTWFYEVENTTIGTSDFEAVDIEVADAFGENTGYDPDTDSIIFESPVELSVYWADVKKSAGATLQPKNFKTIDLKKASNDAKTYTGSLPLNDKDTGVKIAENKAAYIYASINAPAEGKNKYKANFVVDATPYKKIAVTFAYALADEDKEDKELLGNAIATITTIDTKKKTVIYSGKYDEEKNPENYLYDAEGKPSKIFEALQYSTDGTTWYGVNDGVVTVNKKETNVSLNLNKLYGYVNSGSKTTLYFRIKGAEAVAAKEAVEASEGVEAQEAVEAKNAYRATKAEKAKITAAKQAKAVKVNVANGTLALKNGYDFAITTSDKVEPKAASAYTILPFNKEGKATAIKNDEEVATAVILTENFVPVKKVADNKEAFTNIKVKSLLISDIEGIDTSNDMYIWIRKSATANKPAEKWVCIKVGKVTAGPTATAKGKTYYSAQDPADTKGTIAAPEIKNGSGDKNSGAYEYLIVDAADVEDVDMSTAVWTALGSKGLTVGKSKSKYGKAGKSATDHVLKDGSVVLIRRAGDKDSYILASNPTATMIVKQDLEIEVEKDGKKTKETKSLYVWTAYSAS